MIHDLDPEAWALHGLRWATVMPSARRPWKRAITSAAAQAYLAACRLYTLDRWPVMSSPKKSSSPG